MRLLNEQNLVSDKFLSLHLGRRRMTAIHVWSQRFGLVCLWAILEARSLRKASQTTEAIIDSGMEVNGSGRAMTDCWKFHQIFASLHQVKGGLFDGKVIFYYLNALYLIKYLCVQNFVFLLTKSYWPLCYFWSLWMYAFWTKVVSKKIICNFPLKFHKKMLLLFLKKKKTGLSNFNIQIKFNFFF